MSPIVIGYHLIWTIYGYWLPNDPRGSTSKVIRRDILKDLGALHHGRKRVQPASRDIRAFYHRAKRKLVFPIIDITPDDVACVAEAFARVVSTFRYTCYACAIMPDHVHLVIRKHKHLAEEMIWNCQRESHVLLRERGLRELDHPVWGGPGWKVFLDHPDDVRRTIGYVQKNPLEIGRSAQHYGFVKDYDGWPLHPGHDPKSPYAKRLRP
jgi:REP element-mobilizing transposase RayT